MRGLICIALWAALVKAVCIGKEPPAVYYIDAEKGNDLNTGLEENVPWQTLARLQEVDLRPGDTVRFKRGSVFTGPLFVNSSGAAGRYITLADYGNPALPAPSFTNPVFASGNFGNCIRIRGSYVLLENVYCHKTPAYVHGSYTNTQGWDTAVWEMGAIYIDKSAEHCIVRNNEIEDCVAGIKSYGPFALIENNYIHDCNRVLKQWGWGPIGIWLGADHQEVRHNRVFNYRAEDPRIHWKSGIGGGADGGALEIDDARYAKTDINIHHNYTRDCQGFLEVTWTDILQHPGYRDFRIHHNVSDDYQQFLALWDGRDCRIENNTIIRRKKNINDWGVFNIARDSSANLIRNNIIVTEKDISIFNTGLRRKKQPASIIQHNLYYAASGRLVMGREGPGEHPVYGDPLFVHYQPAEKAADFSLRAGSAAIDRGADAGYNSDFNNTPVPEGAAPDIGAFEWVE